MIIDNGIVPIAGHNKKASRFGYFHFGDIQLKLVLYFRFNDCSLSKSVARSTARAILPAFRYIRSVSVMEQNCVRV